MRSTSSTPGRPASRPPARPAVIRSDRFVPGFALDMSLISGHRPVISSRLGGSVNVTPSFWNWATRCTNPPPTTNTEAVSWFSSDSRYPTAGAT